jgi:cadmium resistance protein CadD (predicted permease)
MAVLGFIVQFVGLRALHWSATIIQLGVTLLMTAVRAWVRRGLASDPSVIQILDGHEKAWFALRLRQCQLRLGAGPSEHTREDSGSPQHL